MSAFIINMVRAHGTCVGSITTRRVVHLSTCRFAGSLHHYGVGLDEALRISRFGGLDGYTHLCQTCSPWSVMRDPKYPRDSACVCPHWRTLNSCPIHGAVIRALEDHWEKARPR